MSEKNGDHFVSASVCLTMVYNIYVMYICQEMDAVGLVFTFSQQPGLKQEWR